MATFSVPQFTTYLDNHDATRDTTVILWSEFHEINNVFVSKSNTYKRNWNIASTKNITYAPIQTNWTRNIAPIYFSHQQPASNFIAVSNFKFHPCELRHQ